MLNINFKYYSINNNFVKSINNASLLRSDTRSGNGFTEFFLPGLSYSEVVNGLNNRVKKNPFRILHSFCFFIVVFTKSEQNIYRIIYKNHY